MTTLIDREVSSRKGQGGYRTTAIYHMWQRPVRVRIRIDSYEQQSYAVAEILTRDGWSVLVDLLEPAARSTSPYKESEAAFAAIDEQEVLA